MPTIAVERLRGFARDLFTAAGVPADDAERVATSLVEANLCGHDSHGVLRVPQYVGQLEAGLIRAGVPLTVVTETPALVAADGNWGLGQVQAHRLLERLVPKARQVGVAAGTLKHCGHVGRLGEYAEAAAREKLVLIAAVNNHGTGTRVAPPGGREARLSTNPLCIGAPTPADPLVLDMGTSVAAEGKVRVAFQKGEPVPAGWLLDADGRPTTDPGVLYREPRGSILPFGGAQAYKGFGLALLIDVLAGGLTGASCARPDPVAPLGTNGVLFVAFDIARVGGTDHFLGEVGRLSEYVRGCPTAEGVPAVQMPGDPERRERQRRAGGLVLAEGTWKLLAELAGRLKVDVPEVVGSSLESRL